MAKFDQDGMRTASLEAIERPTLFFIRQTVWELEVNLIMKKVPVIITRGGFNNLLQACEWISLAAGSGIEVSEYFRDEAAGRMSQTKIKKLTMSSEYRGRETAVRDLLQRENKADLPKLLQNAKESGNLKLSVCKDSLRFLNLKPEDLIPEIDEFQTAKAFEKEAVLSADQVLTF